jgi:putative transposase
MLKAEIQLIKKSNNNFKQLNRLSKLTYELYCYVNNILIKRYKKGLPMLNKYSLISKFRKRNNIYYRSLPSHVAANTVTAVFRDWKSFIRLDERYNYNKSYFIKKRGFNPKKLKDKKNFAKPNLPGGSKRGRCIIIFDKFESRIKDNTIIFNKNANLKPVKTKVAGDNYQQVRFIPIFLTKYSINPLYYKAEVIYKCNPEETNLDPNKYIAIDFGAVNLITIVFNIPDINPIIIKAGILKNINDFYYHKLLKYNLKQKEIKKLTLKRNNKLKTYIHYISKYIIDICLFYNIGNIIIGKNKGWKNAPSINRSYHFKQIPFLTIQNQIEYKAYFKNINVIYTNESYTSKCDALAREIVGRHLKYLGKRIKRGLFRSSTGKMINADVNAGLNILRKVLYEENVNWNEKIFNPKTIKIQIDGKII